VRNAQRLALHLTNPAAEDDPALLATISPGYASQAAVHGSRMVTGESDECWRSTGVGFNELLNVRLTGTSSQGPPSGRI
jgi:hypothetical protein